MRNLTRLELGDFMHRESEKMVLLTALLFLTVASFWSHFALGALILEPTVYMALLLVHACSFLAIKYKNLRLVLVSTAVLSTVFYFRNCFVQFKVPYLPIAPVFFIVSALTLTGYIRGQLWGAGLRFTVGWASAFYWANSVSTETQQAGAILPLYLGAGLNVVFFAAFFTLLELFRKRFSVAENALGSRTDYDSKRIHAAKLQTLGELAASVAHEINTPLTSIKGYNHQFKAELLESEKPDKELLVNFSERIAFNLDRVAQITKILRSFSRDSYRDEMGVVSLKEVFEDTLTLLKHHLRSQGIDLVVDAPGNEVWIRGNLVQLSQLLVNLLTNARDACATSKVKKIVMGFSATESKVQLWVEDTGSGIPETLKEEIFRPFFTTKEAGSGTGLGLYISQLIAEKHQSPLKFDCPKNERGEVLGTRFYIELQRVAAGGAESTDKKVAA